MLVSETTLGAFTLSLTSAMPLTVVTNEAMLFTVFGSWNASFEVSVAVLVTVPGVIKVTTIVCVTVALVVSVPILKVISPLATL